MNAETIRDLLGRRPFESFEIHMTNGNVHQVRHPEMVMIVRTRLVVGYPDTGRIAIPSLLHVATIEMQQAA
jgi:hypothetical protein